jgi:hypothetical protein
MSNFGEHPVLMLPAFLPACLPTCMLPGYLQANSWNSAHMPAPPAGCQQYINWHRCFAFSGPNSPGLPSCCLPEVAFTLAHCRCALLPSHLSAGFDNKGLANWGNGNHGNANIGNLTE